MYSSVDSTQPTKKKIKFKIKKSGNKPETLIKKLDDIYSNNNLSKSYLKYDVDIDELFLKNLSIDGETPDLNIINSLPKLELTTEIVEDMDPDELQEETSYKDDIDDDIDKDALEVETVGSKKYYLDYTKGIIYDLQYNAIGNIDEFGEINIA